MIEAWRFEHFPLLYAALRRLEMCGWVLRKKNWHSSASWRARVRALLLALRGYEYEVCAICGGRVGCVWHCDDHSWRTVTGWTTNGVSCVRCFERLANDKGMFVEWKAEATDF